MAKLLRSDSRRSFALASGSPSACFSRYLNRVASIVSCGSTPRMAAYASIRAMSAASSSGETGSSIPVASMFGVRMSDTRPIAPPMASPGLFIAVPMPSTTAPPIPLTPSMMESELSIPACIQSAPVRAMPNAASSIAPSIPGLGFSARCLLSLWR